MGVLGVLDEEGTFSVEAVCYPGLCVHSHAHVNDLYRSLSALTYTLFTTNIHTSPPYTPNYTSCRSQEPLVRSIFAYSMFFVSICMHATSARVSVLIWAKGYFNLFFSVIFSAAAIHAFLAHTSQSCGVCVCVCVCVCIYIYIYIYIYK
jgi:hypothetical protein